MSAKSHESLILRIAAIASSAVAWLSLGHVTQLLAPVIEYGPGIDLLYLPAGVRLGIVLLFGVWGAVGIAIASPLLFLTEFGDQNWFEVAINSLISGFVPLFTVQVVKHLLGVGSNLEKLRAIHLPLIALAVSVTAPLAFNLSFVVFHYEPVTELWSNLSAMILGDFAGCLIILAILRLMLHFYRKTMSGHMEA